MLVPEHTWGMDEKTHLDDHDAYDAESFKKARGKPNFKKFESSWVEKRAYIDNALNALEDSPLADEARKRLESIRPQEPQLKEWVKFEGPTLSLENENLRVIFDPVSAEITSLVYRSDGQEWCSPVQRMASYAYQTFSSADYDRFIHQYILSSMQTSGWALEDFGKPGLEKASPVNKVWHPKVEAVYLPGDSKITSMLFKLGFEDDAVKRYGAPRVTWLRFTLTPGLSRLNIDLQWFHKSPCRMPEALWLGFTPVNSQSLEWKMEKLGKWLSPLSIVENGNRHLHAVGRGVTGSIGDKKIAISPLDSALVAPGEPSLLDFNNHQPDLSKGMHFCLLDNLWVTNFPMWFEEDCRFRFVVEV